jgi:ABC-type transport system substrate-binding protein
VRKAISYAVDRQGIIDAVASGLGKPIYSAFTQDDPIYNPNVEKYDFDPEEIGRPSQAGGLRPAEQEAGQGWSATDV